MYCLCMHGLLVGTHGHFKPNVYSVTLKYSGTHPFFTLMCTRIKHLGKVFIKTPKFYFPVRCEDCCLVKLTYRSHNECREDVTDFDFSIF